MEVHFKFAAGLKTSDGGPVKDIQIAGVDKVFVPADSRIENELLIVRSAKIKEPRFVRYGYTPYTLGNLINKHNLPASTFSNE